MQHCVNHPYAVAAPNHHSGASRNLGGRGHMYRHSAASRNLVQHCVNHPYAVAAPNRHSAASRNLVQHCVNHPYAVAAPNRHSGASRNLVQHCEPSLRRSSPQPSFRLAPESRSCGHIHRHSSAPEPGPSAARRLLTFRRHHSLSLWHDQSDYAHPLRPAPSMPSVGPDFRPPIAAATPHPAPPNPKSRKFPPNDDARMLDFAELIRHTISNQVKEIRFCHNPTGRQRPFVGTKSQRPTQTAAFLI